MLLLRSAVYGAGAWMAFGALEYTLWAIWPRFVQAYCGATALIWSERLSMFAIYPAVGAIATALAAWIGLRLLPARPAAFLFPRLAILTLLAATALGSFLQFGPRGLGMALFVMCGALAASVAAGVLWPSWARATRSVTNIWTICAMVLGTARLGAQGDFGEPRIFIYRCVAVYAAVTGLLVVASWRRSRGRPGRPFEQGAYQPAPIALVPVLTAAAVVILGLALDRMGHFPASRPAPVAEKPNVLLVVLDTVRADHLSVNGYSRDTTPNLKALAAGATLYRRALSPANHTLPGHASMFTGLYPVSHAAHPLAADDRGRGDEGSGLASRFQTLAERLASAGYLTAAVAANYAFVSNGYHLDQGFDSFASRYSRCAAPSPFPLLRTPGMFGALMRSRIEATPYQPANEITRDVLASIDRLVRHPNPFFQFVNYMDAHWPYIPPEPYASRFSGKDDSFDDARYRDLRDRVLQQRRHVTDAERAHLLSQYDGGIAFTDDQLGRLFDHLKTLGAFDRSLIIVTSDHGEAFGERDLIEHGTSVYQDQVHVPLIIKFPNQQAPAVVDAPVSTTDLLPTVLSVIGVRVPEDVQGLSLAPDAPNPSRGVISESYPRPYFLNLSKRFHHIERAYVRDRYKLIVSGIGPPELYDIWSDPDERQNLAGEAGAKVKQMQAELDGWLASAAVGAGEEPQMDSETLERLRSLGYVK